MGERLVHAFTGKIQEWGGKTDCTIHVQVCLPRAAAQCGRGQWVTRATTGASGDKVSRKDTATTLIPVSVASWEWVHCCQIA